MNLPTSANVPALRPVFQQILTRMEKTAGDFQGALGSIRTGRASVHLLDSIRVEYYGTEMPLNQLATVHVPDPQSITVSPFDAGALGAIEKAIRGADLGLNPGNDGKLIRIPIPPLTAERRQDFVKVLHRVLEEHRTGLRNIRRDGNDAVKKLKADKAVGEDEERRAHEDIQKLTDAELKKLEDLAAAKEKEITSL
ncbi:MAG TPA: ribosome recycling factor [Terriglobales bacterium]|nr:ribosome recycling factor [Terriglobales bacterium]